MTGLTLSLDAAAQVLTVHPKTLQRLAHRGLVPACKLGRGCASQRNDRHPARRSQFRGRHHGPQRFQLTYRPMGPELTLEPYAMAILALAAA
jgi:hypothetical protein